jgi:3'-phosphoadenosine 5'-phosphosulfate sulfotransferase (PAPS reductase)/FAD synthetase
LYAWQQTATVHQEDEANRIAYLENALQATVKKVIETKKRPIFTTALIAGDSVILDAIAKAGLLDKIDVIFIDTFFLFPESVAFIKELEDHYGFKAKVSAAVVQLLCVLECLYCVGQRHTAQLCAEKLKCDSCMYQCAAVST